MFLLVNHSWWCVELVHSFHPACFTGWYGGLKAHTSAMKSVLINIQLHETTKRSGDDWERCSTVCLLA